MYSDKVCEHCRIGMKLYSLYGTFRVYECIKDIHPKDWLAGFNEPCDGNYCTDRKKNTFAQVKAGAPWYTYTRRYKQISRSEMKKSEDCIRQEEEERKEKKKEAERLRSKAEDLIIKARSLEE